MKVHLPNRPESDAAKAMHRAISRAAERAYYPTGAVKNMLTYLLEEITNEMLRGNAVLIRGWAMIGTRPYKTQRDPHPIAVPFFAPSRGLRHAVRYAMEATTIKSKAMKRFQKANRTGSKKGRGHQQVWNSQEHERERLKNDVTQSIELD